MHENDTAACRATLEGEWSMDKAADLRQQLTVKLRQLLEATPRPDRVEVDLDGVSDLDACGCQLLLVFLENLKRQGIAAVPLGIPQQIIAKIELLGFSEALFPSEQKESA